MTSTLLVAAVAALLSAIPLAQQHDQFAAGWLALAALFAVIGLAGVLGYLANRFWERRRAVLRDLDAGVAETFADPTSGVRVDILSASSTLISVAGDPIDVWVEIPRGAVADPPDVLERGRWIPEEQARIRDLSEDERAELRRHLDSWRRTTRRTVEVTAFALGGAACIGWRNGPELASMEVTVVITTTGVAILGAALALLWGRQSSLRQQLHEDLCAGTVKSRVVENHDGDEHIRIEYLEHAGLVWAVDDIAADWRHDPSGDAAALAATAVEPDIAAPNRPVGP